MKRRIGLLFDCLRAPYDAAHIIQVAESLGNCDLYFSGNSIDINNKKIITKVKSWGINTLPKITSFKSLDEAVDNLHKQNKHLIGTFPNKGENLYDFNFCDKDYVIVFGTETSGLTQRKEDLLDGAITIPMDTNCRFLTLPTVVPIISYEIYRQMRKDKYETT